MRRLLDLWRRRELACSLLEEYDYENKRPIMSYDEAVQRLEALVATLPPLGCSSRTWSEVAREKAKLYPR